MKLSKPFYNEKVYGFSTVPSPKTVTSLRILMTGLKLCVPFAFTTPSSIPPAEPTYSTYEYHPLPPKVL